MKLVRIDNPRPGQQVQCSDCGHMNIIQATLADLDATAGTYHCVGCVLRDRELSRAFNILRKEENQ